MRIEVAEATAPGPNDTPPMIEQPMTNGDFIRATRTDPYGFWYLSLKSGGPLPTKFRGAYTSRDAVNFAILTYLDERRLDIGPSTRPELKYKPGYGPDGKKLEK